LRVLNQTIVDATSRFSTSGPRPLRGGGGTRHTSGLLPRSPLSRRQVSSSGHLRKSCWPLIANLRELCFFSRSALLPVSCWPPCGGDLGGVAGSARKWRFSRQYGTPPEANPPARDAPPRRDGGASARARGARLGSVRSRIGRMHGDLNAMCHPPELRNAQRGRVPHTPQTARAPSPRTSRTPPSRSGRGWAKI
jgi:hypothetical protein